MDKKEIKKQVELLRGLVESGEIKEEDVSDFLVSEVLKPEIVNAYKKRYQNGDMLSSDKEDYHEWRNKRKKCN